MLSSIAVFFILMPYLSPIPLGSDVQPIAGMLSALWLLLNHRLVRISSFDILFLFFVFLYSVNVDRTGGDLSYEVFRKHINLLYIYPIYLFAKNVRDFKVDVLVVVFLVIFAVAILQVLFPSVHALVMDQFLRYKEVEFGIGARGLTILAPEPTDMGFTAFYYFVLISILAQRSDCPIMFNKFKVGSFIVALLTLSGSSVFAFFFSLFASIKLSLKKVIYVTLMIVVLSIFLDVIVALVPSVVPRPFFLLHGLLFDPLTLIGSSSLGYRFAHFWIGFSSLFIGDYPVIGSGIGSLRALGPSLLQNSMIMEYIPFTAYYQSGITRSVSGSQLVSSAGQLMLEMGLFGLTFIVVMAHRVFKLGSKLSPYIGKLALIAFILFLFQSFPLSYPLPWFVLGVLSNPGVTVIDTKLKLKL